jgi:hypothetical protein
MTTTTDTRTPSEDAASEGSWVLLGFVICGLSGFVVGVSINLMTTIDRWARAFLALKEAL